MAKYWVYIDTGFCVDGPDDLDTPEAMATIRNQLATQLGQLQYLDLHIEREEDPNEGASPPESPSEELEHSGSWEGSEPPY